VDHRVVDDRSYGVPVRAHGAADHRGAAARGRAGSDTQAERKKCTDSGCKIGGTKSCSTAANIKTCRASLGTPKPRYAALGDALLDR